MERFIQHRLEELQSQQETRHLVVELSSKITDHRSRVRQVLCSEPLRHAEVAQLVMVGMATDRPLKSNFFPGLLEGLLGRLGIVAPGESKPPTSSREGAGRLWSSAVREAVLQMEQREVETPGSARLPQCLDLHYEEDFLEKRSHQVQAVFSTRFSFLAWLMQCTRHSSLQCCLRPLPPLVAARFHPPQVSQRTVDPKQRSLNRRGLNRRSLPQAPQRPVNGSRSKSPRLLIPTRTRPMSLLQTRNRLLEISKSRSPVDSGNTAARP